MQPHKHWLLCIIIVSVLGCAFSTLSSSDRQTKKKKESKVKLSVKNVHERGLVSKSTKAKDILNNYKAYCDVEREMKQLPGLTLGYVTPWNSHGYDIAKTFGHKFSFISPVWLQLKRKPSGAFVIDGGHDIDKDWIQDVIKGRKVKMMPRLLFDGWNNNDYHQLFSSEDAIEDCIKTIVKFVQGYNFHGVVLEVWSQLGGHRKSELAHFVGHLGDSMRENKLHIILVLPPPVQQYGGAALVSKADFDNIIADVDAVSLMTYDYSNPSSPGPNSPMSWMRQCVEALVPDPNSPNRQKILLGLNFYGNDYTPGGGGPIIGHQYIEILEKHKPKFHWDANSMEHVLKYKTGIGERTVFFPTLYSIQQRIELAKQLRTGISVWEIGQGLDYFYDLI